MAFSTFAVSFDFGSGFAALGFGTAVTPTALATTGAAARITGLPLAVFNGFSSADDGGAPFATATGPV